MESEESRKRDAVPKTAPSLSPDLIRADLERVLRSDYFRHSDRLSRFLRYAAEQVLQGRPESLKEYAVAIEVFERDASYEPHVDSTVRVQARRVRDKLKQYYQHEGARDAVRIELPKGTYVPIFHRQDVSDLAAVPRAVAGPGQTDATLSIRLRRSTRLLWAGVAVMAAIGTAGFSWWLGRKEAPRARPALTRLTWDSGLSYQGAISPDGKMVAFVSDRGANGNLDIWVQEVAGRGEPIRLTSSTADDTDPVFSPNGSQIAFRSERQGGGVYLVPSLGGGETFLVAHGRQPRFSPDGQWIAYWVAKTYHPACAKLFVIPSAGGAPRQVAAEFRYASHAVWTPDGRHLLFEAMSRAGVEDWWVIPVAGGPATPAGAAAVWQSAAVTGPSSGGAITPDLWDPRTNTVFLAARSRDTVDIWQVPISKSTWRLTGPPVAVTSGAEHKLHPQLSGKGQMCFSSLSENSGVFQIAINGNSGHVLGAAQPLGQGAETNYRPVISADGSKVAYLSFRSLSDFEIRTLDLETGQQARPFSGQREISSLVLSASGDQVAFTVNERPRPNVSISNVFVVAAAGGAPVRRICEGCGEVRTWSPDGGTIAYQQWQGGVSRLGVLDVASGVHRVLVENPPDRFFAPAFSADGQWIAFIRRAEPDIDQVVVAPFRRGALSPQREWIVVAGADGSTTDIPRWSPDGKLLYFVSDQDGFLCIWARRLEPATKRPVGGAFPVYHLHQRRHLPMRSPVLDYSVSGRNLVYDFFELKGSLWLSVPIGT